MDLAIAFRKPHTAIRPVIMGVNHFPVITALDIDGADGFELVAELVDEVGGLEALARRRARRSRAVLEARLRPTPPPQADAPRPLGALPGANDRHLAEFMPSVPHRGVGVGAAWGIELTPMADEQSTRPNSSPK